MKIVNLHNSGRTIFKFIRNEEGVLSIEKDNSFFPYYYEQNPEGTFTGYLDRKKYKKVCVPEPHQIRKQASPSALGIDIPFTKNYIVDNGIYIEPTKLKIFFVDIEIKTDKIPKQGDYSKPISSIAVYDYTKKTSKCFFVGDILGTARQKENIVIDSFCAYVKAEAPDLLLIWNGTQFDIPYLTGRYKKWAKLCSPVGLTRYGYRTDIGEYINLPIGIAVLDYMELLKKYTLNKLPAYNLNAVLEQEFGEGKEYDDVDFNKISQVIKDRNIADVVDMARIEDKYQLIDYFNTLRCQVCVDWEELQSRTSRKGNKIIWNSNNSKILDTALLRKAKQRRVILPNKPRETVQENYDGAMREAYQTGLFFNVHKVDFDTYYPRKQVDFCLDPINFVEEPNDNTVSITIKNRITGEEEKTYHVIQNKDALLPSVISDLIELKLKIKRETKLYPPDSKEGKLVAKKYKVAKSILNSCYGTMANQYFRMFDRRVAETTTFLARDLALFLKEHADKDNNSFIYIDTDGIFYLGDVNYRDKLNEYIQEWASLYNVPVTDILDLEGTYSSLILIAKCRYYGRLLTPTGFKEDKCGVEALRSDSTLYMKRFQTTLFNKVLDGESCKDVTSWIIEERNKLRDQPLDSIAKPVKVQDKEYATSKLQNNKVIKMPAPPSVRGRLNANCMLRNPIKFGERFYILNMLPFGIESSGHSKIHLGFKNTTDHIDEDKIDWKKMIELNIDNKASKIFEVLKWEYITNGQQTFNF